MFIYKVLIFLQPGWQNQGNWRKTKVNGTTRGGKYEAGVLWQTPFTGKKFKTKRSAEKSKTAEKTTLSYFQKQQLRLVSYACCVEFLLEYLAISVSRKHRDCQLELPMTVLIQYLKSENFQFLSVKEWEWLLLTWEGGGKGGVVTKVLYRFHESHLCQLWTPSNITAAW